MTALVVPSPKLIPADYADQARHYLAAVDRVDDADDLRRRLAALRKYVTDRQHRDQLQAAECWAAIRIGELLGPDSQGQDGRGRFTVSLNSETADVSKDGASWFTARLFARRAPPQRRGCVARATRSTDVPRGPDVRIPAPRSLRPVGVIHHPPAGGV